MNLADGLRKTNRKRKLFELLVRETNNTPVEEWIVRTGSVVDTSKSIQSAASNDKNSEECQIPGPKDL